MELATGTKEKGKRVLNAEREVGGKTKSNQ